MAESNREFDSLAVKFEGMVKVALKQKNKMTEAIKTAHEDVENGREGLLAYDIERIYDVWNDTKKSKESLQERFERE